MASEGEVSIRRSPDKVIYIRWGDKWPAEPPSGENWLAPIENDIRFMYHPVFGFVLFYIVLPIRRVSHAKMISTLINEFGFLLPCYDTWVRADVKRAAGGRIKVDEIRLGATDLETRFQNFRAALTHLRTLEAVPCNYTVRMMLESGNIARTRVRDWCKCCEDR